MNFFMIFFQFIRIFNFVSNKMQKGFFVKYFVYKFYCKIYCEFCLNLVMTINFIFKKSCKLIIAHLRLSIFQDIQIWSKSKVLSFLINNKALITVKEPKTCNNMLLKKILPFPHPSKITPNLYNYRKKSTKTIY